MLRVDAYYFANCGKNLRFQTYRDTCERSLEGLKIESTMGVSKTRGRGLSFFNEWCFRVYLRLGSGSGLGLTLTLSLT